MSRYLIVAHRTADSAELVQAAMHISEQDPYAEFVALAPVRPVSLVQIMAGEHRNPREIARWRALRTAERLQAAGCKVVAARPGSGDPWLDPVDAIDQELRNGRFKAVIISTLPHPFSEWLRRDVPGRLARRRPGLAVIHVKAPSLLHLEQGSDRGSLQSSTHPQ